MKVKLSSKIFKQGNAFYLTVRKALVDSKVIKPDQIVDFEINIRETDINEYPLIKKITEAKYFLLNKCNDCNNKPGYFCPDCYTLYCWECVDAQHKEPKCPSCAPKLNKLK